MNKNNYLDEITIYAKAVKTSEIINIYENFGWVLKSQEENKKYDDIIDLTFTRPHNIKNKDELQLLQVHTEDRMNELGKLERFKNAKTSAYAFSFGVLSLGLLIIGILCCLNIILEVGIIVGCISIFVGLALIIVGIIFIPKLHKIQHTKYITTKAKLEKEINTITNKAFILQGGKNE